MPQVEAPSQPITDAGAPADRPALIAGTIAVFLATFLFRFLTIDFTNDQFQHLARARQILLGELPVRDFFDPGLIGQYYASAAALRWSGHNLYGEGLLNVAFIAAGAALNFAVSARLTRSYWLALASTFLVVISMPRLYNYPKLFFYVAALAGAWRYAWRPTRGNLVLLAAITAIAFLFRHDHGVYIGLSMAALMAIVHWPRLDRAALSWVTCGAITFAFLLPWIIFVQSTVGLPRYFTGITPQMRHVSTVRFNWLPISIDWSAPVYTVAPPPDRRIHVRWADEIDDAAREARQGKYGLTKPDRVEGPTWSYSPSDERPETIRALLNDPAVADTHGIDRPRSALAVRELWYERLRRWFPPLRTHFLPGVFDADNALGWFYYMTVLLPFAALMMLIVLLWRQQIARPEAAVVAMAILLSCIVVQTLVRGSPDSRLADVSSPICVIGAWVASRCLIAGRRRLTLPAIAALFLVSTWSIGTDAHTGDALITSRILTGPAGIAWKWDQVSERLKARPISNWERTDSGVRGLGRYVFECTEPFDRVLVAWFAPEIFFFGERGFAGGQVYLRARWHASELDQRLTIERMQQERVPIVLVREDQEPEYRTGFPLVHSYVQQRYKLAPASSDQIRGYQVYVDRQIAPSGTYDQLGLPCYR